VNGHFGTVSICDQTQEGQIEYSSLRFVS